MQTILNHIHKSKDDSAGKGGQNYTLKIYSQNTLMALVSKNTECHLCLVFTIDIQPSAIKHEASPYTY